MDKDNLVFEDFKDRVGSVFTVREDRFAEIALTLNEAAPLPTRFSGPNTRPPFSLIFLGADPRVLPQRLYRLAHDEMGEITLFLVPIGKDKQGVSYQALFN